MLRLLGLTDAALLPNSPSQHASECEPPPAPLTRAAFSLRPRHPGPPAARLDAVLGMIRSAAGQPAACPAYLAGRRGGDLIDLDLLWLAAYLRFLLDRKSVV